MINNALKYSGLLFLASLLIACGGGGSGGGSGGEDRAAPVATIQFPPEESMTDEATITVRGTATDGSSITAVRVNGVDVVSDDGFATWQVALPLDVGTNTLAVETVDARGNSNSTADTATVHSRAFPFLQNPGANGVVVDAANNRALVLEAGEADALFAFDLSTGERTVLSSTGAVDKLSNTAAAGGGVGLTLPSNLVLDQANNRVIVTDLLNDNIVAFDLNTGERTVVLNQNAAGGSGPAFRLFRSALLDAANNRLLLMDGFNGDMRLFAVNLSTRNRTIISATGVGSGPALNVSEPMALDSANNRLLVADRNNQSGVVLSINLSNGNRQVISGFNTQTSTLVGAGTTFLSPASLHFDSASNVALIADGSRNALFLVDLTTGARTLASGIDPGTNQAVGSGPAFRQPVGADFVGEQQAVVLDEDMETAFLVDLVTGDRQLLPGNAIGSGPRLETPRSFALNGNRLLVADAEINALMAIDVASGDRSVFLDGDSSLLEVPRAIVLDNSGQRAFVLDNVETVARLLSLDLQTRTLSVISGLHGSNVIGAGPALDNPEAMVFDAVRNRLLVVDSDALALFSVDPVSGDRTVISGFDPQSNTLIGAGDELDFPTALALSRDNNSVLVADSGRGVLLSIDLTTGDRTPVTATGSNFVMFGIDALVLDNTGNRALAGNGFSLGGIVAIDLTTGAISTVTGFDNDSSAFIGTGPEVREPVAMIVDAANNRLQVLDSAVRGVFAIDLATGNRVITSWTDISPQNNLH